MEVNNGTCWQEPPCTEPYARWCGRTAGVTPPPTRLVKRLPIMTHIGIGLTRHRPYKILNQLFILLCRWVIWMPMMGQYLMPINSRPPILNGLWNKASPKRSGGSLYEIAASSPRSFFMTCPTQESPPQK